MYRLSNLTILTPERQIWKFHLQKVASIFLTVATWQKSWTKKALCPDVQALLASGDSGLGWVRPAGRSARAGPNCMGLD